MEDRLPLSSLLSQALVAFIIEFDNEFERMVPHRTGRFGGARPDPWLVSMAMWSKFLRFVPEEGISAKELHQRLQMPVADMRAWMTRLSKWWGYLIVGPVIRPTPGGRRAIEAWRPLTGTIAKRWRERFGDDEVDALHTALAAVAGRFEGLPDNLPIAGFGLWSREPGPAVPDDGSLPGLLSKVLLAFAMEYESQAQVSLAIGANVLRLVPDEGVRLRDLPRLSGVSKEAIAMAAGYLARQGFAVIGPQRLLRLTEKGSAAREEYSRLVRSIEKKWKVPELRAAIARLPIEPPEPPPGTWRSKVPRPATLPHFPVILHRGGFPDGA